jgi:hypothetical protein
MGVDPEVPVQALIPATAQTALIVLTGLGFVAVWVYAIVESRRRRDLVPVLVVAGAGLAVFYEALGDSMAKVHYAEQGQLTWIHAFGRGIPAPMAVRWGRRGSGSGCAQRPDQHPRVTGAGQRVRPG